MKIPQLRKQLGSFSDDSAIEAIQSISSDVKNTIVKDLGKDSLDTFWAQVVGAETNKKHTSGDLKEGQEVDLKNAQKEVSQHIEAAYNYRSEIIHGERRIHTQDSQETQVKIQEVMIEIKKLIDSSKELQVQFKSITVEQAPQNAGKYHLNFVEWLLQNVREIRMQIEDSGAWMAAFKSKKNKRGYWNMFKKHGTSFGLSNERSVATQVG
jgi:hypothetical protein